MTLSCESLFAIAEAAAPVRFVPPRGIPAMLAKFPPAAALLAMCRRITALRNRSGGGGRQPPPEPTPKADSIWDDPDLWMLMIH